MYNPNFFNPYQPYQNAINNPYQFNSPRVPGYSGQVIQVNGRAGAEALQMEPNSSIYVQDSSQGDRIFLCMTDGAGYKTIRGIIGKFEEDPKVQQDTAISQLEARIDKLEDIVNGYAATDAGTTNATNTRKSAGKNTAADK